MVLAPYLFQNMYTPENETITFTSSEKIKNSSLTELPINSLSHPSSHTPKPHPAPVPATLPASLHRTTFNTIYGPMLMPHDKPSTFTQPRPAYSLLRITSFLFVCGSSRTLKRKLATISCWTKQKGSVKEQCGL